MKKTSVIEILVVIIVVLLTVIAVLSKKSAMPAPPLPFAVSEAVMPKAQMPAGMLLKTYVVPSDTPPPTIDFSMSQDSMNGWEIKIDTTNFNFSPEHLNDEAVNGEGHVHLYIDDNLIIMLGPWYHLASLTPGEHTVRVGLFNNDHSAYAINDVLIQKEKTISSTIKESMDGM